MMQASLMTWPSLLEDDSDVDGVVKDSRSSEVGLDGYSSCGVYGLHFPRMATAERTLCGYVGAGEAGVTRIALVHLMAQAEGFGWERER